VTQRKWLDEREQRAWRAFLTLQDQVPRRVASQLQREKGLSGPDYEVLVQLSEAPGGRMRSFELGKATHFEKSRLSHHLSRMACRGLVAREGCPTDNRGAFVVLTDKGRAAIEDAAPVHVEHVRRWFIDALTRDELDALVAISEKVATRMAEDDPDLGAAK
jgi:DNA-binding MarR family transcriptional regulator